MVACQQTYTGVYLLDRIKNDRHVEAATLEDQLARVLRDFGFERRDSGQRAVLRVWSRVPSKTAPELIRLDGSGARVTVALRLDVVAIGIRDLDNDVETAFVRELKQRIEDQLERLYGVPQIPFERTSDLLS